VIRSVTPSIPPFLSLDFVYVPTPDVDAGVAYYVDVLGARLDFKVRAMDTVVARVDLADGGPALLLSGHLAGERPILIYRVADYASSTAALRDAGVELHELEIPHGPVATFVAEGGQRIGVYELVRPDADEHFSGRIDI
jgi:catechol 2,3-dioxygenase-like lactoylglutathione lyase family enzyme